MKRKYVLVCLLIIISTLLLSGCGNPFLPIYEKTEENGMTVIIDGVKYVQQPQLNWDITATGKVIGYAGSRDIRISKAAHDDTNFVYVQYAWTDYYDSVLYRTDRDVPDVSAESVDRIVWEESGRKDSQTVDSYTNTIEDKEVIKERNYTLTYSKHLCYCSVEVIKHDIYGVNKEVSRRKGLHRLLHKD